MRSIFISYDASDRDFATQLKASLADLRYEGWLDFERLQPSVIWSDAIDKAIQRAVAFIYLVSPQSTKPKSYCLKEFNDAMRLGKKIIPILLPSFPDHRQLPEDVGKYHFFHWHEFGTEQLDISRLHEIIRTNFDWAEFHAALTEESEKWISGGRRRIVHPLSAEEARNARRKISTISLDELPQPTVSIRAYVTANEKRLDLRRRLVTTGSIALLLILGALASYGLYQSYRARQEAASVAPLHATTIAANATAKAEGIRANQQAQIARAGKLAKQAGELRDGDPVLSFLLSVEAYKMADDFETRSALLDNALAFPNVKQFIDSGGNGLAFSSDGKTLARASGPGIILYDTTTWRPTLTIDSSTQPFAIRRIAFSPNGKMLASGNSDGSVYLWNVADGQVLYTLTEHAGSGNDLYIVNLMFDSGGQVLAASNDAGKVSVWRLGGTDRPRLTYTSESQCGSAIALSPDGKTIATCDDTGYISLWETTTGERIGQPFVGPIGRLSKMVFSADGKTLVSGDFSNNIVFWDVPTGQPVRKLVGAGNQIKSLALSPDGKTLAYSSYTGQNRFDSRIFIWDIGSGQLRDTFVVGEKFLAPIDVLAFSPDGRTLGSTYGGLAVIWDMMAESPIVKILAAHHSPVRNVDFGPDNTSLTSISDDGTAITWNTATGQILSTQSGQSTHDSSGIGPHGDILVTQPSGGTITLFDTITDKMIGQPLTGHTAYIETVAFSPDGKVLATGSDDKTIILWDIQRGQMLARLTGHTGSILGLAFSPDGKKLASASADNTVRVWDIDPQSWEEQVCQRAGRNFRRPMDTSNMTPEEIQALSGGDEWTQYFPGEDYRITCPQWATQGLTTSPSGQQETTNVSLAQQLAKAAESLSLDQKDTATLSGLLAVEAARRNPDLETDQALRRFLSAATPSVSSIKGDYPYTSIAYSPDLNRVVLGSEDGVTRVLGMLSGNEIAKKNVNGPVVSVDFSADGKWVAQAACEQPPESQSFFVGCVGNAIVRIWEVDTGKEIYQLKPVFAIRTVKFTPDGQYVAMSGGSEAIQLWEPAAGKELRSFQPDLTGAEGMGHLISPYISAIDIDPSGKWIVAGNVVRAQVWNVATGQEVSRMEQGASSVAFSPDAKLVASAGGDVVRIWDAETGKEVAARIQVQPISSGASSVKFSPDSKWIAVGSGTMIRIWEISSGLEVSRITNAISVNSIAYSTDGKWIASGLGKSLWRPEDLIAEACNSLLRNFTPEEWKQYIGSEQYRPTCPNLPIPAN